MGLAFPRMPMDQNASGRLLTTLERLLEIPTGDLKTTFVHATDLIAQALGADKVDAFIYDPARDSLVAVSSSNQPVSALQKKLGLDILPLANGGRVVWVYKTGKVFVTGHLTADAEELRGVKEGLHLESKIGVPLEMDGTRRGMVMIASQKRDLFTEDDARYAEMVVRWTGVLGHRAELAEKMRRNAVEQSRRALAEELVAVVAHDLRNYITPIELRLDLLRRLAERERQEEVLGEVRACVRSVAQLGTLVSDLLDVARLEYGVFRVDPATLDLAELAAESARTLARPAVRVDVRVQSTGLILVTGDGARLRQCLDNLLVNAIEQSPEGAAVTVMVASEKRVDGEYGSVEVIDEGPGVPPELIPRIFERLATSKNRHGGLGLGLYLAKRIAEMRGGDLTVDSSPGKGARFKLVMPCRLMQRAEAAE
jgi:two-component system OmpR family sensor kinase